ncbi:MAG: ribulose-phosphate 3-epimerase, partial [Acidobacteria bacterium]|nr:ribulose-phosphate 3-epimerase [Acidobacteriota bacterium]
SVHQEVCPHLDRTLHMIRSEGAKAGVVINPSTPVSTLAEVLEVADFVLVMSVNPGFGGQAFIPRSLDKVRNLDNQRRKLGLPFAIEIDGGITTANLADAVRAGCDWIVTGSSVFHSADPGGTVGEMFGIAEKVLGADAGVRC